MIALLVRLLRPLFEPLLKLDLRAPHLPEGSTLVRAQKPSDAWLTWRYLQTLFGLLGQVVGAGVAIIALVVKLGTTGLLLAALVAVVELLIVGFALVTCRLDFELRHYLIGDHSLRVSMGALKRREVTLSYANVQNLEVNQGPLERLFGFKSLTVSTAGGDAAPGKGQDSMHSVTLVGLENAEALRELIMGMLRQQKDTGLGDVPLSSPTHLNLARLVEVRDAAAALARATGA